MISSLANKLQESFSICLQALGLQVCVMLKRALGIEFLVTLVWLTLYITSCLPASSPLITIISPFCDVHSIQCSYLTVAFIFIFLSITDVEHHPFICWACVCCHLRSICSAQLPMSLLDQLCSFYKIVLGKILLKTLPE